MERDQRPPRTKRVEAFEAAFAKVLPGFYEADRVKDYHRCFKISRVGARGPKDYPRRRAGIQRVSRQFRSLVAPAQRQFEFVFGPMHGYPPIYLVNSFGEFDGGTRDLAEGNRLMFGADMIDEIYTDKPMKPFVEHELFHLMHHRTFPECDPVWCNLWEEGLATFVASKLNPGAPDAALGLTIPEPLRPAVEGHRQEALCAVRDGSRFRATRRIMDRCSWAAASPCPKTFRVGLAIMSACWWSAISQSIAH